MTESEEKSQHLPWKVLADRAVESAAGDHFGVHTSYANLLIQIATDCTTPFTIALYGTWGTGKTSVTQILRAAVIEARPRAFGFVFLDVWKYSSDPLKRWVLLETCKQLTEQDLLTDYKYKGRSLESHLEFEEEWEDCDKLQLNLGAITRLGVVLRWLTIVALPLSALLFVWGQNTSKAWDLLTGISGLVAAGGVLGLILQTVLKKSLETLQEAFLKRKTRHVTAKPAFSSEKFGEIFADMARKARAKLASDKLIFVFDNLDRCPEQVAVETIGVIKTFLEEPGCVYVVPCDQEAVVRHVSTAYVGNGQDETTANMYAKEYLNKFFQMTLRLPAPPEIDIEAFVDDQLRKAEMNDLPNEAREVIVYGYKGETPRQVKRVINDLIGYRALASQVEGQSLVDRGALTSDLPLLTKMCVISVYWPEFIRKIAEDPEYWSEVNRRLEAGDDVPGLPTITKFLRATRLVSPEADIRPYVHLKLGKHEKDVTLRNKIEGTLRNGEADQFVELLTEDGTKIEQSLQIALFAVRAWRSAKKPIALRNSVPCLVRACLKLKDHAALQQETINLLEHIAMFDSPETLEKTGNLADVLSITERVNAFQRRAILRKLKLLFQSADAIDDRRLRTLILLIENGKQFDAADRDEIAKSIEGRFRDTAQENVCLQIADFAAKKPAERGWCIAAEAIGVLANRVQFSKEDIEKRRMNVVLEFQDKVGQAYRKALFERASKILAGGRNRSLDTQNEAAMLLVSSWKSRSVSEGEIEQVGQHLIEQTNYHPLPEKGAWISPLVHLYSKFSPSVKSGMDSILSGILADPSDVAGLSQSLQSLGLSTCGLLLDIPIAATSLKEQVKRLQARFGAEPAAKHREQLFQFFPPLSLLAHREIFDPDSIWDLVLYPKVAEKALLGDSGKAHTIAKHLLEFASEILSEKVVERQKVYQSFYSVASSHEKLMTADFADKIADCALKLVPTDPKNYFPHFEKSVSLLGPERRIDFVRKVESQHLKPRVSHWAEILGKVSDLVSRDPDLSGQRALVTELVEFAFEAAKDNPGITVKPLVQLVGLLDSEGQNKYTQWAVDRLHVLEGTGAQLPQMEPFLNLVENFTGKDQLISDRLAGFTERMLSLAKSDEQKVRILEMLSKINSSEALEPLTKQLEGMAHSEGESEKVRALASSLITPIR